MIIQGDCLLEISKIGKPTLIYADPPFNVGRNFVGRSGASFVDTWENLNSYLDWLEARIYECHSAIKDNGSFWLHLDHRAVHEAKAICDSIFAKYQGEIIWETGNGLRGKRVGPGITHQTILIYSKAEKITWNTQREPYADTSKKMHINNIEEGTGRRYRKKIVAGRTYIYYEDEGRAMGSVWVDCPSMSANSPIMGSEGYPTQKPISLLTRIVKSASNIGDLVLDPFCGSGTTCVAAMSLGRKYVGIDASPDAVRITKARLRLQEND